MKIGIHHLKESTDSFSDRWIAYCEEKNIPYKIVNAFSSDIIKELDKCNIFMWHHHQNNYQDMLFAKQLLFSLELAGKKVFPNFNTGWHFDDKIGQKYLFEAMGAPLVPSYVFYTKKDALEWINQTTFPKVFKLRGGAGSSNVKLAKSKKDATYLVRKAFGKGFSPIDRMGSLKEHWHRFRNGRDSLFGVCKGMGRLVIPPELARMRAPEKGYVYFQDFIPNNNFDIRVIVIDKKAFAIKRICRENDFRASGSGRILYAREEFDVRCVEIAIEVAVKLNAQSAAFDFIFDEYNVPLVVEISYGFAPSCYERCEGYWDINLNFHEGGFNPYGWMVDQVCSSF